MKLVNKKEFTIIALNLNTEILIGYRAFFTNLNLSIQVYPFCNI